jgi:hypothetical protein
MTLFLSFFLAATASANASVSVPDPDPDPDPENGPSGIGDDSTLKVGTPGGADPRNGSAPERRVILSTATPLRDAYVCDDNAHSYVILSERVRE